jgi:hypothetical protein
MASSTVVNLRRRRPPINRRGLRLQDDEFDVKIEPFSQ